MYQMAQVRWPFLERVSFACGLLSRAQNRFFRTPHDFIFKTLTVWCAAQFVAFAGGICFATLGSVLTHNAVWARVQNVTSDINTLEKDVPGLTGQSVVR